MSAIIGRTSIAAFLGAAALGLSACGGSETESEASDARQSATRTTTDSASDSAAETEAASADEASGEDASADKVANNAAAGDGEDAMEAQTASASGAQAAAAQQSNGSSGGGTEYASLTGNADAGKRVFVKCRACHVVEEGQNRVGPSLYGIVGREAGSVEGFNYSEANANSGITWTEEVMFEYLENPQEYIPGTRMIFPGLPSAQDRADVIAYLKSVPE